MFNHIFLRYRLCKVIYIPGKQAVLTVYDGDIEMDRVALKEFETRERMHSLMKAKGFKLKGKKSEKLEENDIVKLFEIEAFYFE